MNLANLFKSVVVTNFPFKMNSKQIDNQHQDSPLCPSKVMTYHKPNLKLARKNEKISTVPTIVIYGDLVLESRDQRHAATESHLSSSDKSTSTEDLLKLSVDHEEKQTSTADLVAPELSRESEEKQTSTEDLVQQFEVDSRVPDQSPLQDKCDHHVEFRNLNLEMDEALNTFHNSLKSMEQDLKSLATGVLQLTEEIVALSSDKVYSSEDLGTLQQGNEQEVYHSSVDLEVEQKKTLPPQFLNGLQYLNSISSMVTVKFDGESRKYEKFKFQFQTIVDSMSLTDADKGLLLYLSLEDTVTDYLVDFKEEGHISYQRLWTQLDLEFQSPLQGRLSHVTALFGIASMDTCDTLDKLVKLYRFVKRHYVALQRIDAAEELEAFKLSVLSKLQGEVADEVSEYIIKMNGKSVGPGILNIIREQITLMEIQQVAASIGEVPTSSSQSTEAQCIFCQTDQHSSSACNRYRSPNAYRKTLCQRQRCFNCLCSGHKGSDCPYPRQCNLCQDYRKHSQLLCSCNY